MVTLVVTQKLTLVQMLLLGTRDIGEFPLAVWLNARRRSRELPPSANVAGKLATVMQFAAVIAALVLPGLRDGVLIAAALTGVVAAVSYWARALGARNDRSQHAP